MTMQNHVHRRLREPDRDWQYLPLDAGDSVFLPDGSAATSVTATCYHETVDDDRYAIKVDADGDANLLPKLYKRAPPKGRKSSRERVAARLQLSRRPGGR